MVQSIFSKDIDSDKPVKLGANVWWVGHYLPEDSFQCHVYLIENGTNSVLVDPGSCLTFRHTLAKIEQIIPFSHIRYFICHHQDPDITGAMPLIDQIVSRKDACIVSHWRAIALLKHLGLGLPLVCVEELEWSLAESGLDLDFVFTPYLHFPGAFCTFEKKSGILFSSDIFGGFNKEWKLLAEDESCLECIRPFHEHYMPSRDILFNAMLKIERLPLKLIAPQHGQVIASDLIPTVINFLKSLDCGLFRLSHTSTDVLRLSSLNKMLRSFLDAMTVDRELKTIAEHLQREITKIVACRRVSFYAREEEHFLFFGPETRYRARRIDLDSESRDLFSLDQNQWLARFEVFSPKTSLLANEANTNSLLVPLFAPETGTLTAIAVLTLGRGVHLDQETSIALVQISSPLSVAVEREMIHRRLQLEKQKYYERSIKDHLTGLYTREYMQEVMRGMLKINERNRHTTLYLLMLDLDHFKRVNDVYGHNTGDEVLVRVSRCLRNILRGGDICVRLGGEEFAAFLIGGDLKSALQTAERVRLSIEELDMSDIMGEGITVSCGVAKRRLDENLKDLLARGDLSLYEAKKAGRNRVHAAD